MDAEPAKYLILRDNPPRVRVSQATFDHRDLLWRERLWISAGEVIKGE